MAALAGLAPVNIGTDGGGSLRIPASFTGTIGFKPSYGRVANYPTGPNWGFQHIGPIARRVEDIAAVMDVLAVHDDRDPYSLPPARERFSDSIRRTPPDLKVLFCPDFGYAEAVDPEVVTRCREAVACLHQFGCTVTEDVPGLTSPMELWQTMFVMGIAYRRTFMPTAPTTSRTSCASSSQRATPGTRRLLPRLACEKRLVAGGPLDVEQYDLVASPVTACPPFALGEETPGTIAGKPTSFYGWLPFTVPFNVTGQPAIGPGRVHQQRIACGTANRRAEICRWDGACSCRCLRARLRLRRKIPCLQNRKR